MKRTEKYGQDFIVKLKEKTEAGELRERLKEYGAEILYLEKIPSEAGKFRAVIETEKPATAGQIEKKAGGEAERLTEEPEEAAERLEEERRRREGAIVLEQTFQNIGDPMRACAVGAFFGLEETTEDAAQILSKIKEYDMGTAADMIRDIIKEADLFFYEADLLEDWGYIEDKYEAECAAEELLEAMSDYELTESI